MKLNIKHFVFDVKDLEQQEHDDFLDYVIRYARMKNLTPFQISAIMFHLSAYFLHELLEPEDAKRVLSIYMFAFKDNKSPDLESLN